MADRVRWGIIGTASIAARAFLPAVTEAGGVAVVAGRDASRAAQWARENGIGRVIVGYQQLVDDPDVDAVYIPLPNSLHAEWTIKALRAGKPVLCEKPLTASPAEAEQVLAVAAQTGTPLWEAFVFPFHDQMTRIRGLLADGIIGELREIQSNFHFALGSAAARTRMSASLAGGALYDVGCYPVRLARDLFGGEHDTARAGAVWDSGRGGRGDLGLARLSRRPQAAAVVRVPPGSGHVQPARGHRRADQHQQPVPPLGPGQLPSVRARARSGELPGGRAGPVLVHPRCPAHPGRRRGQGTAALAGYCHFARLCPRLG